MKISDIFKSRQNRMLRQELSRMVVGYQPVFSTYTGGVYETDMTVAAIDAFARHVSKATPKIKGSAYQNLSKRFKISMNDYTTTSQFLYRAATIYECEHNVFIVPVYDPYPVIVGFTAHSTMGSQIVNVNGKLILKYKVRDETIAIPYNEVAHIKSHQYKSELFGDGHQSLQTTLELLDTQNQGIINGIKQSAVIRFIVKVANMLLPKDLKAVRDEFTSFNLSNSNDSGALLYDTKVAEVKQVESRPFIIDDKQAQFIRDSIHQYFGTNDDIMSNKFNENSWAAYYEGKVEPFLTQLGQALTMVMFTTKELAFDNEVVFESTRLEHADIKTKWEVGSGGIDRGLFTINEVRVMMNFPEIEGGDVRMIRKEYGNANEGKQPDTSQQQTNEPAQNPDPGQQNNPTNPGEPDPAT